MGKVEQNVGAEGAGAGAQGDAVISPGAAVTTDRDDSTITLGVPVKRGEGVITSVRITDAVRQPGSLRGLKLYDVMQSDVDSLIKMIPRVTEPALMEHEILTMDNRDFVALATGIVSFLVPN
ncbi:phage tail assembly protein [Enterobacter asburiae]|uniref:phage tail assembly protein n=1 Tax=Enterobacter asburiae TaxID=61645 RepID=UPI003F56B22A